jgi:hypothetical protein
MKVLEEWWEGDDKKYVTFVLELLNNNYDTLNK